MYKVTRQIDAENLILEGRKYKYNAIEYVDPEDIVSSIPCIYSSESLFLYQFSDKAKELYWESKSKFNIQLFWAANSKASFLDGLLKTVKYIIDTEVRTEKVYIEFIPEEFLIEMIGIGFTIVSEWIDFWKTDLSSFNVNQNSSIIIRLLNKDEISTAGDVTRSCSGYSRGFLGQSDQMIEEWRKMEHSSFFVAELDGTIVGMCFVILYGFDSEKGPILWLRELAVDPIYQAKGIGRALASHSMLWGKVNGARRSFLACDAENYKAIKLYESLNYTRKKGRGQINMELELLKVRDLYRNISREWK